MRIRGLTRVTGVALALVLGTAGVAACSNDSSGGSSGDDFTVGIVALDATQITANRERAAATTAMKKKGWKVVEVNSNGNPANAISAMQNLIQRQVNALIVQTYTPDQIATGLAAAKAAKIPVFSTSGGSAGGTVTGAIEVNNAAAVNDAMIAAIKDLPKVNLLELRYTPGAPCRARAVDLDAKLKALPNVSVTRQEVTIPGGEQSAQSSTSGWLQSHPDAPGTTNVIWPCFSEAAVGAVSAQKQLKRGPYPLYTWDISKPAVAALQEGTMTAVLWIQNDKAGEQIAAMITKWRDAGDSWKQTTEPAPSVLLTKDSIAKAVADNPNLGA